MAISSILPAIIIGRPLSTTLEQDDAPAQTETMASAAATAQDAPTNVQEGAQQVSSFGPFSLLSQAAQGLVNPARAIKDLAEIRRAGVVVFAGPGSQVSARVSEDAAALAHVGARPAGSAVAVAAGADRRPAGITLLDARIAAARALFGATTAMDDAELLGLANSVHRDAMDHPADNDRRQLSMLVWNEESLQWARGYGEQDAPPEDRLIAYRQMWQWALNPPPSPQFKSRVQLAREVGASLQDGAGLSADALASAHQDTPAVIRAYYSQFSAYIESHLERFCELSAVLKAGTFGLSPLFIRQKPRRIWAIDGISASPLGSLWPIEWRQCASFVFQMPDMSFGFIDEAGRFRRMREPVLTAEGELRDAAVLRMYGRPGLHVAGAQTVSVRAIDDTSLALKDLVASRIRDESLKTIAQWKESNYDPSLLEKFLRVMVPFYEVAHRSRYDPGYHAGLQDIALDVLSVTLALGAIGVGAVGGVAGVRVALAAARGAAANGTRAMISSAIRSGAAQFSSGALLRTAGRELTDLVIPVFSASDLLQFGARRSADLAARGVAALAHPTRVAIGIGRPTGVLERIYATLSLTQAAGSHVSASHFRHAIDAAADLPVPPALFRGQSFLDAKRTLHVPQGIGASSSTDDYLVACLKHASSGSIVGVPGAPMSLSADRAVARRFAARRENGVVLSIDTTRDPGKFRTLGSIIKYDGPRLVEQKKISAGTLRAAVRAELLSKEREVFYLGWSIPDEFIGIIG
jgi:hypothetical protein